MFDIVSSDIHILWLYSIMDRIYKYNPDASYKPNDGRYLQLITAKDLYIQNITVAEHDDGHQPMCTTLKTANFILEQCFISSRITKLREAGQVQARSGMSH